MDKQADTEYRNEIIEMAKEAGFDISKPNRIIVRHSNGSWISIKFELEAFAKLVDAKATAKAVEREREACAKAVEDLRDKSGVNEDGNAWLTRVTKGDCVKAIRARGEST